ncbi:hypothetical protein C0J52_09888 [Blattella germanica]|nr:hypothetical protein C0J52_09888 [Blattella germanica]
MATFSLQEQRVIIRFLHLRGVKPIEIHRQLSETCGDDVMDVSNVRSWVRQFKEGRTSCDNKTRQSRPRTSRSDDMIQKVEKVVLEDRRMTVEHIASKIGISTGSVHTILLSQGKMNMDVRKSMSLLLMSSIEVIWLEQSAYIRIAALCDQNARKCYAERNHPSG